MFANQYHQCVLISKCLGAAKEFGKKILNQKNKRSKLELKKEKRQELECYVTPWPLWR